MTRHLSILAGWMLFASTASAQHNATVQTKGTVADGEVAVFDGVTGKFIRSAGDTNVTHYYTNLIAILEAATNGTAQLQVATNTLTANVDALIIATNLHQASIGALVTATNTLTVNVDALIVATNNLNVDVDKLVIATNLHQASIGALVTATNTLTVNVDALIIGTNNLTGDVDNLVTATNLHEAEINAIITATNLHQVSITALVIATNGLTSNVVALVTATNTLTVNVDALIIATNLHQASIGALVTATNTLTANLDALIMTNSAFGGDASGTYAALVVTQVADRALATVTNQLTLGVTAYGWGNHSTNGYLTQGTNRWDELFVANLGSTGANMVVNGGFTNVNNWALSTNANIAGGILNVNAGLGSGAATQTVTFTRAKTHKITLTKGTTAGTVVVGIGSQTSTIASNFIGEWIGYLPSVATNDVLHLVLNASASLNQYIDDITVAEVTDGDLYVADNAWVGGDLYLGETNSIYFSDPAQGGPSLGSLDILSWKSQGVSNAAFVAATNNLTADVDKLVTATNTLTVNVDALIIATNNLTAASVTGPSATNLIGSIGSNLFVTVGGDTMTGDLNLSSNALLDVSTIRIQAQGPVTNVAGFLNASQIGSVKMVSLTNRPDSIMYLGTWDPGGGHITLYGTNYGGDAAGDVHIEASTGEVRVITTDPAGDFTWFFKGRNLYNDTGVQAVSNAWFHSAAGVTIKEFSIDGTMSGNSDSVVPTEKAVKTYVAPLITATNTLTANVDALIVATNNLTAAIGGGGGATTNDSRVLDPGAILGLGQLYSNTTTIVIQPGIGYCYTNWFQSTQVVVHAMTSLDTGFDIHYLYIDESASTFPHTLVVYDATNEWIWSPLYEGWYHPATVADRGFGALLAEDDAARICNFVCFADGTERRYTVHPAEGNHTDYQMATSFNPDESPQVPTTDADVFTPIGANRGYFRMYAQDSASSCMLGLSIAEISGQGVAAAIYNQQIFIVAYHQFQIATWIDLGPSRQVRIFGQNDDDNALNCYLQGYSVDLARKGAWIY